MFSAILAYIWTCYKGVVDKSAPCLYQCFSDSSGVINWTSEFLRLDKHSMVSYMPGRAKESPLSVDFWVGKWLVIQFFWILSRKVFWLRPFHAIPLACRVGCPRPSVTLSPSLAWTLEAASAASPRPSLPSASAHCRCTGLLLRHIAARPSAATACTGRGRPELFGTASPDCTWLVSSYSAAGLGWDVSQV